MKKISLLFLSTLNRSGHPISSLIVLIFLIATPFGAIPALSVQAQARVIFIGIVGQTNPLQNCSFIPGANPFDFDPRFEFTDFADFANPGPWLPINGADLNSIRTLAQGNWGGLPAIGFHLATLLPDSLTRIFSPGRVSTPTGGGVLGVTDWIKNRYEIGDLVFLAGHSSGGGDVVDVAINLKLEGIPVQLLAMIDSVEICGLVDATIPSNTEYAMGFYQTQTPFPTGGENNFVAEDSRSTGVTNILIVNPMGPANYADGHDPHRDMDNDERVWKSILNYMLGVLFLPTELFSPLGLSVHPTPDPVRPGDLITYTYTVTNRGATDLTGVELSTLTPEHTTVNPFNISGGGGGCGVICAPGEEIVWSLGTLFTGQSVTVQMAAEVHSGTSTSLYPTPADGTVITNTAVLRDDSEGFVAVNKAATRVCSGGGTACDAVIPELSSPEPGSTLAGSTVTFQWTGSGVTWWWLTVGTSQGGYNLYNNDQGTSTSVTVSGLPTDGSTIYVRLYYQTGGTWKYIDATYTAAGASA